MKAKFNKTYSFNILALIFAALLLMQCSQLKQLNMLSAPQDVILMGHKQFKIYKKKPVTNEQDRKDYGKFEYWVTDATDKGFALITDSNYNEGDTLRFTKR